MKDRFDLLLQPPGDHRLSDPVRHGRDGCFILPLLQSRVGISVRGGCLVDLVERAWCLVAPTLWSVRRASRGLVRRAAGLRCPDSVMRLRHWVSMWSVQGMQSRLPGPRRASSLPVLIQS